MEDKKYQYLEDQYDFSKDYTNTELVLLKNKLKELENSKKEIIEKICIIMDNCNHIYHVADISLYKKLYQCEICGNQIWK